MLKTVVYSVALLAIGAIVMADSAQAQGRGRGRGAGMGRGMGAGMGAGQAMGRNGGPGACRRNGGQSACALPAASGKPLQTKAKQQLRGMREEEKLAHDVYVTLGEKWDVRVFANISSAESRHMSAIAQLLKQYDLKDPVTDTTVGVFHDPKFQTLYKSLVARGSKSLADAYQVGCLIEELDIADLKEAKQQTDHADVQFVLDNLERASRNHLRAFASMVKATGGSYQAQHLKQAEFDQIARAEMERGGRWAAGRAGAGRGPGMGQGRGMGRGRGMGQGRGPGMGGGYGRAQGGRGPGACWRNS